MKDFYSKLGRANPPWVRGLRQQDTTLKIKPFISIYFKDREEELNPTPNPVLFCSLQLKSSNKSYWIILDIFLKKKPKQLKFYPLSGALFEHLQYT